MIGKTCSHYRIEEELGSGGSGVVYKAFDTRLRRTVAIKFLHEDISDDAEILKRFEHEARAAAGLSHPNIMGIHDFDEVDGRRFLVLEYVRGCALSDLLGRSGPFPMNRVAAVGIGMTYGLQHAHERGVIHRDIKSSNVVVDDQEAVKILDFGFAYLTDATRLTRPGFAVGTLAYISPEQLRAEEIDARTDLWSLGVVLYEMITGELPFKLTSVRKALTQFFDATPAAPSGLRDGVPPQLERIVMRCLEKDREERYPHASDVGEELRQLPV